MALVLKIDTDFSNNCKGLVVFDDTGDTAAGSWGVGGNPLVSTVLTATIAITLPDGTVIAPINVYPTLPNLTEVGFTITNVMLGLSSTTPIPSGAWVITYTVTGISGTPYTYTTTTTKFFACSECCCLEKATAKVTACGGKCKDLSKEQYSNLYDDVQLMLEAAKCNHLIEANEYLANIQLQCLEISCGCS